MAAGVYTGGGATVVMNPPPLVYVEVFKTGSGPDRHLRRKAVAVALTAKVIAPRRTGRLAASISVDQNRNERGQYAFGYAVSAGTGYGYYVHEGTGPSLRQTFPNVMKFQGSRDARTVYTDIVRHPGTPAQPFLQAALFAMVD